MSRKSLLRRATDAAISAPGERRISKEKAAGWAIALLPLVKRLIGSQAEAIPDEVLLEIISSLGGFIVVWLRHRSKRG